jgi:Zn-dependent M16 (insulinase) family peptidase
MGVVLRLCNIALEHLVFLGSELYPYKVEMHSGSTRNISDLVSKGVLDSLANRALAQGTNAWTATDHTCYTITTAGSSGFLNILPG